MHNLRERRCIILVGQDVGDLIIAFQLAEVHKPLLAVSFFTAQGHKAIFADHDDHILSSSNQTLLLRNADRVF